VPPPPTGGWPGPTTGPQQQNPWSAATTGGGGWQQGGGPNGPQGGQPNWQYPPIPIPKPPGPGRRRKPRQLSKGLLIMLVALAVLVVGSGVTVALKMTGDDPTTPVAVDTPSETPSQTPSETPSATPSPTPAPTPKPTPKPKPKPRQPTPYETVAKNKIYSVGVLQPTKCVEPPYRPTTFAATKAYYQRLLPCLNRTWWLALKKSGQPFRAPHLIVYANQVKTPCGTERGTRGFYCGANEAIYMPFNVDYNNYKINPTYTRAWMLNTFAHEYGHHIQQLTGIFRASFARQATMADPNLRLLESRRRELQAACFGSAYLGANAAFIPMRGDLLNNWKFAVANAGDEFSKPKIRDHGSKVNHNRWSTRGFNYKNPIFCNTFSTNPQYTS
jgi:predicted metalloprotease